MHNTEGANHFAWSQTPILLTCCYIPFTDILDVVCVQTEGRSAWQYTINEKKFRDYQIFMRIVQ